MTKKLEIFNHSNILDGYSSVVWDPKKEKEILDHFRKDKDPQGILIRNFEEHVQSIQKLNSIKNLKSIVFLSEVNGPVAFDSFLDLRCLICSHRVSKKIDLNKLTHLKILSTSFNNIINLHLNESLEILHIDKPKSNLDISNSQRLKEISFQFGNLTNLVSLSPLKQLQKIEIRNANSLLSLEGLNENHKNVEYLEIFSANKLINLNAISSLTNLKALYLQRIPDLKNLTFLQGLNNLERLVVGCNVSKIDEKYINGINEILIPGYGDNTLQ